MRLVVESKMQLLRGTRLELDYHGAHRVTCSNATKTDPEEDCVLSNTPWPFPLRIVRFNFVDVLRRSVKIVKCWINVPLRREHVGSRTNNNYDIAEIPVNLTYSGTTRLTSDPLAHMLVCPCPIIEGEDGREHGEDQNSEGKSAIFSLGSSEVGSRHAYEGMTNGSSYRSSLSINGSLNSAPK